MKIRTIQVHAGRCFNHPYESYSNLRPEITMSAELEDGEDPTAAAKDLQRQAETLVEDHKQAMLNSIHELHRMTEEQAELRRLGDQMKLAQDRMDAIRSRHPEMQLIGDPPEGGDAAQ